DLRQSGSDGGAHPDGRARRERALVQKEVAVKRFSLALAMVLVVSATAIVAWAQQPAGPPPSAAPAATAAATPAAPAASKIDKGDTAWMLTSSALVLLMTAPGLALFYGGMVRQKNALATLMQSFIILAVISIQWILWGYTLAFGPDKGGIIGGLEWFGLRGVGVEPFDAYSKTIPHQVFMLFQMMFAVITPALITGASLLWFGWFGFNAGSALEANGLAVSAFTATNTGAAAAALGWMFTEWMSRGKPTVLGAASGAVAGLVAITPASGFVGPISS